MPQGPPPLPRVELVLARRAGLRAVVSGLVLAVAGLGALARSAASASPWLVTGAVLVGSAAVLVGRAVLLAVRPPRLVLDAYGVREVGSLRVRQAERWEDCVRFSPTGVRVGFQNRAYRRARGELRRRWLRRGRGYPATVRAGYGGLGRDELCSLLNRYRETFTDRRRQAPTVMIDLEQVRDLVDLRAAEDRAPDAPGSAG